MGGKSGHQQSHSDLRFCHRGELMGDSPALTIYNEQFASCDGSCRSISAQV